MAKEYFGIYSGKAFKKHSSPSKKATGFLLTSQYTGSKCNSPQDVIVINKDGQVLEFIGDMEGVLLTPKWLQGLEHCSCSVETERQT